MRALRGFRIDRRNGKLLGVCAGIANLTGWDPTIVRVGVVLLALVGPFPWTIIPYVAVGLMARRKGAFEEEGYGRPVPRATDEVRAELHEMGRRRAEVETYVAGADSVLAREIEKLR
jgi:phage shock protein C